MTLRKTSWLPTIAVGAVLAAAVPATAGPLQDWFRSLPPGAPPATPVTYPSTAPTAAQTVHPPATQAMYPPVTPPNTTGAAAPLTTYSPPSAPLGTLPTSRAVTSYAPTTAFAPTTSYAPTTAFAPNTGYAPTTAFSPVATTAPGVCLPPTTAAPVCTPVPTSYTVPAAPVCQPAPTTTPWWTYREPWIRGDRPICNWWNRLWHGDTPPAAPIAYGATVPPTSAGYCPPQVVPAAAPQVPQVRYRTTWNRVPVTMYRPVSTIDPATGCPTTTLQPCTTTVWQAQRVPTRGFPFLEWLFGCGSRSSAPPTVDPFLLQPPTVTYAPVAPGPLCPITPAPAADPYYGNGSAPLPGPLGAAASAATPLPLPSAGTAGSVPGYPSPPPASPQPQREPADIAPRLDPQAFRGSSASGVPQIHRRPADAASSSGSPPAAEGFAPPAVRPLPDPDAPANDGRPQAPLLLDPRDRTAARGTSGTMVTPAVWRSSSPTVSPSLVPVPATQALPLSPSREDHWDDSGWHAAGPR